LLVSFFLPACQAPEKLAQCCQLEYGLLRTTDLDGQWKAVESSDLFAKPSVSRYKQVPPQESGRQYLRGSSNGQKEQITIIIHDIRIYTDTVPSFGELDYKPGIRLTIPNLRLGGLNSQIQCLSQEPLDANSLSFCAIETRYNHALSTMYFYFDTAASDTEIGAYINQAFAKTDERIKELDQHFAEANR
jgi:hypothetical protein